MMHTPKKWFTYSRNGIIYVQFKDKITGKKMTAKSTGTRDRKEAEAIASDWYYNPESWYNKRNDTEHKNDIVKRLIVQLGFSDAELTAFLKEHFSNILIHSAHGTMDQGRGTIQENLDAVRYHTIQASNIVDEDDEEIPDEILAIKKRIHTMNHPDASVGVSSSCLL